LYTDVADILTMLPAMGIDFEITPGVGPVIKNPIKSMLDVQNLVPVKNIYQQVPFVAELLEVAILHNTAAG
jgi:uroporphyrinogen decarboxylase